MYSDSETAFRVCLGALDKPFAKRIHNKYFKTPTTPTPLPPLIDNPVRCVCPPMSLYVVVDMVSLARREKFGSFSCLVLVKIVQSRWRYRGRCPCIWVCAHIHLLRYQYSADDPITLVTVQTVCFSGGAGICLSTWSWWR